SALGSELRASGRRSYHESSARIEHLNVATPVAWLHERFLGGRLLGAARRARWPRPRSGLYPLGSPLVPVIPLWRPRAAIAAASCRGGLMEPPCSDASAGVAARPSGTRSGRDAPRRRRCSSTRSTRPGISERRARTGMSRSVTGLALPSPGRTLRGPVLLSL